MDIIKQTLLLLLLSIGLLTLSCTKTTYTPQNGDVIFHTSKSNQSQMISEVTGSKLTHVGIVFINKGKTYVYEAVQPVKLTPIDQWIKRGVNSKYVVLRSKKSLSDEGLLKMKEYGLKQLGKGYDLKFQWTDSKMYCSELVYKVFEHVGISLSEKHTFKQYNLNGESVKHAIKKRYDNNINLNEIVVTPVDLRESDKLKVVFDNY